MKKLFISAVFLMAFSSASMANTIADEDVKVNDQEFALRNCVGEAAVKVQAFEAALEAATHECMSTSDYNGLYNFYLNECLNR